MGIGFVWITFVISKHVKSLDQHENSFRDQNHAELEVTQKFKTVLNNETNEIEKVAGNL